MFDPYLPQGEYEPVPPRGEIGGLLARLLGGHVGLPGLEGVWKALGLERVDPGDILLVLVLLYLSIESDDEDWRIVLALVVLMGLV